MHPSAVWHGEEHNVLEMP